MEYNAAMTGLDVNNLKGSINRSLDNMSDESAFVSGHHSADDDDNGWLGLLVQCIQYNIFLY